VLKVSDVARSFGHVRAVRGISFSLERGQALAVFGPNGAGKTTLLRMLAGILRPDRGTIHIGGDLLLRDRADQRRRIGLIAHQSLCYDGLTPRENLEFFARLYGLADPRAVATRSLEASGLADARIRSGTMSRGQQQRLAIARALLHDPDIVLLDEPFTGLDQKAAGTLREQLTRLKAEQRTVVMVTHNLDEGLELATHVAIQAAGRFVEVGERAGDQVFYRARYAEATAGV